MRSQVSTPTVIETNSPQAPVRTRRRAQSVAVQGISAETLQNRRQSLFETNVSRIKEFSWWFINGTVLHYVVVRVPISPPCQQELVLAKTRAYFTVERLFPQNLKTAKPPRPISCSRYRSIACYPISNNYHKKRDKYELECAFSFAIALMTSQWKIKVLSR